MSSGLSMTNAALSNLGSLYQNYMQGRAAEKDRKLREEQLARENQRADALLSMKLSSKPESTCTTDRSISCSRSTWSRFQKHGTCRQRNQRVCTSTTVS